MTGKHDLSAWHLFLIAASLPGINFCNPAEPNVNPDHTKDQEQRPVPTDTQAGSATTRQYLQQTHKNKVQSEPCVLSYLFD